MGNIQLVGMFALTLALALAYYIKDKKDKQ